MALIRLPGLIDPHVHLRDPGQTEKEDFLTGTTSAIAGGFTTIFDMPNNKVPITSENVLDEKIALAKKKIICDLGFYFGTLGDNLSEFNNVEKKVSGLKVYLNQTTGNFILDKSKLKEIFAAWPDLPAGGLPILFHAEKETFDSVLELLSEVKRPIHLCHMSTEYELRKVMEAKEKGLPVTCGVTPHHLFLTENDAKTLGPYALMKPVLKPKKDVDFLWKNIHHIDMIESDHAPHTLQEKGGIPPPFGVPGLETTLPLLLNAVAQKRLTIKDVIRLCHSGPSKLLGLKTAKSTYIEVDLAKQHIISNKSLFTKCKWTTFEGYPVTGKLVRVTIRGTKVFANDRLLVAPGFGKII